MKLLQLRYAVAVLSIVATPALASDEPVQVNTDGLQRLVALKVEEHAANGMQALRRHLWSTFHLNRVMIDDVLKPKADEVVAYETPPMKKEYRLATRTR